MSSTAVLERAMGRRLTQLERLAVSVLIAALLHLFLFVFLEVAVRLPWLRPRTYLGSVTVELETEQTQAVPEPLVTPKAIPAATPPTAEPAAQPQAVAKTTVTQPASQPLVEPKAIPAVQPKTQAAPPEPSAVASTPRVTEPAATPAAQAQPASQGSQLPRSTEPAQPWATPAAPGGSPAGGASAPAATAPAGGSQALAGGRVEPSAGTVEPASGIASAPLGEQPSEGYVPEVEAPFNPFAPAAETPKGTPTGTGTAQQVAPLGQSRGGGTGAAASAAAGQGKSLLEQVTQPGTGSGTGTGSGSGSGSGSGAAAAAGGGGSGTGATGAAATYVPLPLVDPGGRYEVVSDPLKKGNRGVLHSQDPDLSGLATGSKITVRATIMVFSTGFVSVDRVVGAPSTAIEARIREALFRWSFTPAPGAATVEATVTFTIIPKS